MRQERKRRGRAKYFLFDSASIRIIIVNRVSNPVMQVFYNLTYACKVLSWVAGLCYLESSESRQQYVPDAACFSPISFPIQARYLQSDNCHESTLPVACLAS